MKWYQKILPTIGDVQKSIEETSLLISKIPGVKAVYAWGPYAENFNNKNYHIREIDILAQNKFYSEDLIAIDENDPLAPLSLSKTDLEDLGYNAKAISFTKSLLKFNTNNIQLWCLSKDKKLLHWGIIPETIEEWKELRLQAEINAEKETTFSRKNLKNASVYQRKMWQSTYDQTMQNFITNNPLGWYESSINIDEIFNNSIKLF